MIVAIGECMLELSAIDGATCRLGFGGDTLNTSIYLSRLGAPTAYLTALGTDPFSDRLIADWQAEGIDVSFVLRDASRLPGVYAILTDAIGERTFCYWRDRSAARNLMKLSGSEHILQAALSARLVYLTGITLSLFDHDDQDRLIEICARVRATGGQVAFDPNYRPNGWASPADARQAITRIAPFVTIALPTLADESGLWQHETVDDVAAWWRDAGASETVVKIGAKGCVVSAPGGQIHVPATHQPAVLDTTGAGDGFNAAYLAARMHGLPPESAATKGNLLASAIIARPGAIIAPSDMPVEMREGSAG